MSREQVDDLLLLALTLSGVNVGNFLLHNYDKVLGSILTIFSLCYYAWKWRQEYKKAK